jgi:hypothetical protein
MPPSLCIRRLCDRLHLLANILDKVCGAPASPSAVDECIVQIEASVMLLEHHLDEQARLAATLLPIIQPIHSNRVPRLDTIGRGPRRRASCGVGAFGRTHGVTLKFPSCAASSALDTPRQET